jgi:hypothetical protein
MSYSIPGFLDDPVMPEATQNLVCDDNIRICDGLTMRRHGASEIGDSGKDARIVDNKSSGDGLDSAGEGYQLC